MRSASIIIFLIPFLAFSQDFIDFEEVEAERVSKISSFDALLPKLKENYLENIKESLSSNDFKKFEKFLHPSMNKDDVKKLFSKIKPVAKKGYWDLFNHYETFSLENYMIFTKRKINSILLEFDQDYHEGNESLKFLYTYSIKDSILKINSIEVHLNRIKYKGKSESIYFEENIPQEIKEYKEETSIKCRTYACVEKFEDTKRSLFDILKKYDYSFLNQKTLDRGLARSYNRLSWELLKKGQFEDAIAPAEKAISIDSTQIYLNKELVLAYLFSNNKKKAGEILFRHENFKIDDQETLKESIKKIIPSYQRQGIINKQEMEEYMKWIK